MGVPGFFIWLAKRYPKIIIDAIEKGHIPQQLKQQVISDDPNQLDIDMDMDDDDDEDNDGKSEMISIDNLYLDMNGIIHPCSHPVDGPQPKTEEQMFQNVEIYVNKLIRIVKPKNLIYFAIDGVAPRAKMNQQRSRRFRAAIDSTHRVEKQEKVAEEWRARGLKQAPLLIEKSQHSFDSNVITPGTEFMHRLSISLKVRNFNQYIEDQNFIQRSLKQDENWKNLKIIFSDAQVPGQGEHKLLEFIRSQRAQQDFDPNLAHCIYGADADLIMLALSTHQAHFYILRQVFLKAPDKECTICKKKGHLYFECERNKNPGTQKAQFQNVLFQYIKISLLRDYFQKQFWRIDLPYEFDIQRIIDDIVLLLFLCGNDFLPHLPSLRIAQGAIDSLFFIYKYLLPQMGGYLTLDANINFERLILLLKNVGKVEEQIFRERLYKDDKYREKRSFYKEQRLNQIKYDYHQKKTGQKYVTQEQMKSIDEQEMEYDKIEQEIKKIKNIEQRKQKLEELFQERVKNIVRDQGDQISERYVDPVRLGQSGWKERYYLDKFCISSEEIQEFLQVSSQQFINRVDFTRYYLQGLSWVYQYYYSGCPSWSWYFPYHYAPFCSDLAFTIQKYLSIKEDLTLNNELLPKFDKSNPYAPFEQLMAVMPAKSANSLPTALRPLLLSPETSQIADFYPTDVVLDMNGHRHAWKGVNLLPFIDQARLQQAVKKFQNHLTDDERMRNERGFERIYFNVQTQEVQAMFGRKFCGQILGDRLQQFNNHNIFCSRFQYPKYTKHIPSLRQGINIPNNSHPINDFDIESIDRVPFYGQNAIAMVQKALQINQLPEKPYYAERSASIGSQIRVSNQRENRNFRQGEHFSHSYNNNRGISQVPTLYKYGQQAQQRPPTGAYSRNWNREQNVRRQRSRDNEMRYGRQKQERHYRNQTTTYRRGEMPKSQDRKSGEQLLMGICSDAQRKKHLQTKKRQYN